MELLSRRISFIAALLLAVTPAARAQGFDPSGHWEDGIEVPGREVAFQIDLVRIVMSGNAMLSGYSLPFAMRWTGEARLDPPVVGEPVGKELEGTWSGTLHVNGLSQRAVLTVMNQPDGKSIGRIVSVDEGGLILPVVVAQSGSRVNIEQKGVAGSYAGTLNADGTELTGTFTQHGISVPLTFTRVAQ